MTTALDLAPRLAFAAEIAEIVGRRLLALRSSGRWSAPDLLGDVGDQAADGYLQGALRGRYPHDGILSEETADDRQRLDRAGVWIVDPLDGTKEYSAQRHDFAVHVGYARDGVPLLGAVALPAIGRVLVAAAGLGATAVHGAGGDWPERLAPPPSPGQRLRIVCSRSHTPDWVRRLAAALGDAELVPCGSVGFKVAMLLFGRSDVYVHDRGLKEWDTCAPEVVARSAGFAVCRLDGSAQRYNQPNPRNDQFVVCRPELRERLLAAVAAARA
ncbi:MAG: 3'(2'),5'-bisphosphate nucleotidase CysQ [Planctomycetes bacterium]|nr:3'(2'),5'-bisphosphate nucleotidase CysQ [Planctomycetota bacterium]